MVHGWFSSTTRAAASCSPLQMSEYAVIWHMFACMPLDRALNSSRPVIILRFELLLFGPVLIVMIIIHLYMLMPLTYPSQILAGAIHKETDFEEQIWINSVLNVFCHSRPQNPALSCPISLLPSQECCGTTGMLTEECLLLTMMTRFIPTPCIKSPYMVRWWHAIAHAHKHT